MKIDPNARYTETHEWVRKEGDVFVYGITDHAQESMSDVVFIELPEAGSSFKKGESFGTVESVKAASDLYTPMEGTVVEVNEALLNSPDQVNSDPYGAGWMVKFTPQDAAGWDELLSPEAYGQLEEV
jgi:glycine cleavage system H protein